MPIVNVRLLQGQSDEAKATMAERIVDVIHETTKFPREAVWIVFDDVESDDWFVGGVSMTAKIRAKQNAAK